MATWQEDLPFGTIEDALLAPVQGAELTEAGVFVAGLILAASTKDPITIRQIADTASIKEGLRLSERMVKDMIRTFRRTHGFPICARRGKPAGYWWGRTEAELEEFIKVWKAQYLDEATTLSIMLKKNFPRLAGQLKLALEE